MRPFPLSTAKGGMTRLRDKGGASPDSLYDLQNGYVTQTGSIKFRAGTRKAYSLPLGTKGLCAFRGKLHVFSAVPVVSTDPMVVVNILRYPGNVVGQSIKRIWFAAPFLGFLYVVAEWVNGQVFHYWLQESGTWQPNHIYLLGQNVLPTVSTGYAYQATRLGDPNPLWAPNVLRAVGDRVEPRTPNGYYYEVIDTLGDNPRSGATEPNWIASDGAIVYEDVSGDGGESQDPDGNTGSSTPPPDVQDRYGNQGGYPKCVVASMWVDGERMIGEIEQGDEVDAHDPITGFSRAKCIHADAVSLEECVRVTTENGCWVEVSKTTPVNFADAKQDMQKGKWAYATALISQVIHTEQGPSMVVDIEDIGEQPVAPRDFGGLSFAAGGEPGKRIYTHNMAKKFEAGV